VSIKKPVLAVLSLAFILILGGGIYVLTQINALAKPLVEDIASDVLGVDVAIGEMDIRLKERKVFVRNIEIDNPDGFSKPHVMTIEDVTVSLDAIAQDSVDINDVTVQGSDIYLEVTPQGTNLSRLQKNIQESKGEGPVEDAIRVIVKRFALNNATVHPSVTLVSSRDVKPLDLPPIVLTDIGTKENGVQARDAVAQIMQPILRRVIEQAGDAGYYEGLSPEALKEMGLSEFDQIKTQINEEVDRLKGMFE